MEEEEDGNDNDDKGEERKVAGGYRERGKSKVHDDNDNYGEEEQ